MSTAMKIAIAGFIATVSVLLILGVVMAWLAPAPPPTGEVRLPETGIAPTAPKGPAIGYGEPNDFCATNRLGESFEFNGITYTCMGPKPYRWRAQ